MVAKNGRYRINRNIVECKDVHGRQEISVEMVLIET